MTKTNTMRALQNSTCMVFKMRVQIEKAHGQLARFVVCAVADGFCSWWRVSFCPLSI